MKQFELHKVIINEEGKETADFLIHKCYNLVDIFDYAKEEINKIEGHEALKLDHALAFGAHIPLDPIIIKTKENLDETIKMLWETAKHMRITRVAKISTYTGDDQIIRVDVFDPDEEGIDNVYIGLVNDTAKEYLADEDGNVITLAGTAIQIDEWINDSFIIRSYVYYPEDVFNIDCELENLDDYCMTTGTKYRE